MTERPDKGENAIEFYRDLADNYDDMTRFQDRMESERDVMARWIGRYHIDSAIDAACGTGLHTIVLAQLGVTVIGADISSDMLARARQNAAVAGVSPDWIEASLDRIADAVTGRYDAIFCLGNSIPHLLTSGALSSALGGFYKLLKPNGIAVIQLLNYERVLSRKERIVGIHRQGSREFVRFYDFEKDRIRFNVLTVDWQGEKASHKLISTELYPYRSEELLRAFQEAGFADVKLMGDMQFGEFRSADLPNLVLVASKI